jgi:hypothetical protein
MLSLKESMQTRKSDGKRDHWYIRSRKGKWTDQDYLFQSVSLE